jgi:hypothetical protein
MEGTKKKNMKVATQLVSKSLSCLQVAHFYKEGYREEEYGGCNAIGI